MEKKRYDAVVIGAGVTGSAIARELSRYQAEICVLEKGEDVCTGTSKANSAIVHGGFDAKTGSLKAKMNVLGNRMMTQVAEDWMFRSAETARSCCALTKTTCLR